MNKNIIALVMAFVFSFTLYTPANAARQDSLSDIVQTTQDFLGAVENQDYEYVLIEAFNKDLVVYVFMQYAESSNLKCESIEMEDQSFKLLDCIRMWKHTLSKAVELSVKNGSEPDVIQFLKESKMAFAEYERQWAKILQQ